MNCPEETTHEAAATPKRQCGVPDNLREQATSARGVATQWVADELATAAEPRAKLRMMHNRVLFDAGVDLVREYRGILAQRLVLPERCGHFGNIPQRHHCEHVRLRRRPQSRPRSVCGYAHAGQGAARHGGSEGRAITTRRV